METPKDAELRELLAEAARRDRLAFRRAAIYTAIPVLTGLFLIGFAAYQLYALDRQVELKAKALETEKQAVDEKLQALSQIQKQLEDAKRDLTEKGAQNDTAIKAVDMSLQEIQRASGARWVIIGADKALEGAQSRAEKAKSLGYNDRPISIYLQQSFYRTVIEFSSEEEARDKLQDIRDRLSSDAYARYLPKWCPNPQARDGYFQCSSPN